MSIIQTIPDCAVVLSEGEVVVRTYHVTTNRKPKARGDVAVTNKRIIYQGKGKTSTIVKEVPIETVSAITTSCGSGFNFGEMLIGILCIILGIAFFATIIAPILGFLIGAGFIFGSFNSGYSLSIKSAAVSGTGISVGSSDISQSKGGLFGNLFSTSGQGANIALKAAPTREALVMMNELGAIVLDLKIMGDRAIAKWTNYQASSVDTSVLTAKFADSVNLEGIKNVVGKVQKGVQAGIKATQQTQEQPVAGTGNVPAQPPFFPPTGAPGGFTPPPAPPVGSTPPPAPPSRFTPPSAPPPSAGAGFVPPTQPPASADSINQDRGFFG